NQLSQSFQEQNRGNINTTLSNKAIIQSALKHLFEEKQTDWKRCNFIKT
ncbi:17093_t:CDS:1, partial [Dentiscutata heterogama]